MASPGRRSAAGLELRVRATPRAARAGIGGTALDAEGVAWLAVRVTAAPDSGKANKAVTQLLAARLGVAPSRVVLRHGAATRWKTFEIEGDPAELEARLAALLAATGAG